MQFQNIRNDNKKINFENCETAESFELISVYLSDRVLGFKFCCALLLLADLDHVMMSKQIKQCADYRKHFNPLNEHALKLVKCCD